MNRSFLKQVTIALALIMSSQISFAGPGAGGGTGTGSAIPVEEREVRAAISGYRYYLHLIFNFLEIGAGPYHGGYGSIFDKSSGKNVYERIRDVELKSFRNGRCPLPPGAKGYPEAVAIRGDGTKKDLICFNLDKLLSRKRKVMLTQANYVVEILALLAHELAHLQGQNETQSKEIEDYLRKTLGNEFREIQEVHRFQFDLQQVIAPVQRLLEAVSKPGPQNYAAECFKIAKFMSHAQIIRTKLSNFRARAVMPFRPQYIDLALVQPMIRMHNLESYCSDQNDTEFKKNQYRIFGNRNVMSLQDYADRTKIVYDLFDDHWEAWMMQDSEPKGLIRKVSPSDRYHLILELQEIIDDLSEAKANVTLESLYRSQ